MTKEANRLSIRAYAKHLGVSDKTIRKAIQVGKIKKGVAYKTQMQNGKEIEVPEIILEIADKEYGYSHKTGQIKPGQSKVKKQAAQDNENVEELLQKSTHQGADLPDLEGLSPEDEMLISSMPITRELKYAETVRRREIIELVMAKRKLQQLEGSLVRKDEMEKQLFNTADELKKSLQNIPARITAEVRAADNDVLAQNIITVEINSVLTQLSDKLNIKA